MTTATEQTELGIEATTNDTARSVIQTGPSTTAHHAQTDAASHRPHWRGGALGAATVTIAIYAVHALAMRTEGDVSILRRTALFLLVMAGGGVAWTMSRLGPRARAIAMLLTGVVALSMAGPVIGSRIAKLGFESRAITGVLSLIGAGVLTTIGSIHLIRAARTKPRKLLALPIAFLLFQFVVFPLASAAYTTNAAHPVLGARDPGDLGVPYESVRFFSGDGTRLAAWYVPSENGRAIIVRHGSGSTRSATLEHLAFLADAGYGVLSTDARGHGESGGTINELGWHGPQDVKAAVDYLSARPDVTRGIGILGLSMGGEEAINAAAIDPRLAAVVAEGVGISNYNDSIVRDPGPVGRFVNWTQYSLTELLSDAPQPKGIAESLSEIAPRPALLITGDEAVEKNMGPLYAQAGGPTTALWSLPDTPHTRGLDKYRDEYKRRVLELFEVGL